MPEAYNLRGMRSPTKGRAMTRRSVLTGLLALLLGPALPLFAAVPTHVVWSVSSFGDNDYFVKPFSPLELIQKVEEVLGE